jgi:hypothetical protein
MNRVLRIVMAVMLAAQAVVFVIAAAVFGRMLTGHQMSMNGANPEHAQIGLWAFAACYVILTVLSIRVLHPELPGPRLSRLRRPVLLLDVVLQFPVVMLSLTLAGWPVFAWTVLLLTLLTVAMLASWDNPDWTRPQGAIQLTPGPATPKAPARSTGR